MNNQDHSNDKNDYINKLQSDIDKQSEKLEQVKEQITDATSEKKEELEKFIDGLENKLAKVKLRVADLADAAEDTWEDLTQRADKLRTEISDSLKKFFNK